MHRCSTTDGGLAHPCDVPNRHRRRQRLIVAVVLLWLAPWGCSWYRLGRGRARLPHPQESKQVVELCTRVKAADHSQVIGALPIF
jgi:hypothetical protein